MTSAGRRGSSGESARGRGGGGASAGEAERGGAVAGLHPELPSSFSLSRHPAFRPFLRLCQHPSVHPGAPRGGVFLPIAPRPAGDKASPSPARGPAGSGTVAGRAVSASAGPVPGAAEGRGRQPRWGHGAGQGSLGMRAGCGCREAASKGSPGPRSGARPAAPLPPLGGGQRWRLCMDAGSASGAAQGILRNS